MTTTIKALANLSRRVARAFHRLSNRLTRKAAFTCTVTVAVPPFLKMKSATRRTSENRRTTITAAPGRAGAPDRRERQSQPARLRGRAGIPWPARPSPALR